MAGALTSRGLKMGLWWLIRLVAMSKDTLDLGPRRPCSILHGYVRDAEISTITAVPIAQQAGFLVNKSLMTFRFIQKLYFSATRVRC
jgi:hypothetical protein